jgi:hypothetical protein
MILMKGTDEFWNKELEMEKNGWFALLLGSENQHKIISP